jgi:chaperonin GroES
VTTAPTPGPGPGSTPGSAPADPGAPPIRMLGDRLLVHLDAESAERRSSSGIVIPATATVGRKLAWAQVAAAGQGVRQVAVGDRVLFDPEDRAEVELGGTVYVLLREKDVHGVAQADGSGTGTGLYL